MTSFFAFLGFFHFFVATKWGFWFTPTKRSAAYHFHFCSRHVTVLIRIVYEKGKQGLPFQEAMFLLQSRETDRAMEYFGGSDDLDDYFGGFSLVQFSLKFEICNNFFSYMHIIFTPQHRLKCNPFQFLVVFCRTSFDGSVGFACYHPVISGAHISSQFEIPKEENSYALAIGSGSCGQFYMIGWAYSKQLTCIFVKELHWHYIN